MNDDILKRLGQVCDRWEKLGYSSLSRPEKAWINIRGLIDSIENGGLIAFFVGAEEEIVGPAQQEIPGRPTVA